MAAAVLLATTESGGRRRRRRRREMPLPPSTAPATPGEHSQAGGRRLPGRRALRRRTAKALAARLAFS